MYMNKFIPLLALFLIFISCGDRNEKALREQIEEMPKIDESNFLKLDTLFYKFKSETYPLVNLEDLDEKVLQEKIEYIKEVNPSIKANYYQTLLEKSQIISPDLVNIFLETSASMKGYSGSKIFKDAIISPLVYGSEKIEIFTYRDQLSEKMNYEQFSNQYLQIKYEKHTLFKEMFKQIIEKTSPKGVSFFITDAIIAEKTSIIRTKTLDQLYGIYIDFLNNISNSIKNEKTDHFAISVYRFVAPFNGTYSNCNDNAKHHPKNRPFFVFVIGNKKIVEDFKKKVEIENEIKNFRPENQLHFIGGSGANFIFKSDQIVDNQIKDEVIEDNKTIKIRVSMSNFPSYCIDKDYIYKHTTVKFAGVLIPIEESYLKEGAFIIEIDAKNIKEENLLSISMDITELPAWCKDYSSSDDRDISKIGLQTFYLYNLLDCIREGMMIDKNKQKISTIIGEYKFSK